MLKEVNPSEVLGKKNGPDEVMVLSGELARVESSIGMIEADLNENGESPTQHKRLREKEEVKRGLSARLADAQQRVANPLSEAWGQVGALLATLDDAPDPHDARLRLRSILRRVVSEVRVLVLSRGHTRLCVAQLWFVDDGCRNYLIIHKPPKSNGRGRTEGQWDVRTMKSEKGAGFDLRKPDRAARLAAKLEAMESWDAFSPTEGQGEEVGADDN